MDKMTAELQANFEAELTRNYGEPSKFGGYEMWTEWDGASGDPRESTSIDHRYGSNEFRFVRFDLGGEPIQRWSVIVSPQE